MKCDYCRGKGIDPHDNDPLGDSMNTPCHKCKGVGATGESYKVYADCCNCAATNVRYSVTFGVLLAEVRCGHCGCYTLSRTQNGM